LIDQRRSLAADWAVVVLVAVVLVVPVAFVHLPALLVMVVVGMIPVGTLVGWALPDADVPDVTASIVAPVALGPYITRTGHAWLNLAAERWRGTADVDVDLGDGGCGKGGKDKAASDQVQFPV
jgi:hypothetical protein